jgi:hypothetical protein
MDDEANVQKVLCCAVKNNRHFKDQTVEKAQAFMEGPLETCVSKHVKVTPSPDALHRSI